MGELSSSAHLDRGEPFSFEVLGEVDVAAAVALECGAGSSGGDTVASLVGCIKLLLLPFWLLRIVGRAAAALLPLSSVVIKPPHPPMIRGRRAIAAKAVEEISFLGFYEWP